MGPPPTIEGQPPLTTAAAGTLDAWTHRPSTLHRERRYQLNVSRKCWGAWIQPPPTGSPLQTLTAGTASSWVAQTPVVQTTTRWQTPTTARALQSSLVARIVQGSTSTKSTRSMMAAARFRAAQIRRRQTISLQLHSMIGHAVAGVEDWLQPLMMTANGVVVGSVARQPTAAWTPLPRRLTHRQQCKIPACAPTT